MYKIIYNLPLSKNGEERGQGCGQEQEEQLSSTTLREDLSTINNITCPRLQPLTRRTRDATRRVRTQAQFPPATAEEARGRLLSLTRAETHHYR